MEVIAPIPLNATTFASSLPENEYVPYSGTVNYILAQRVIYSHVVYESLLEANLNKRPDLNSDAWLVVGPTNAWAVFNKSLASTTKATGGFTTYLDVTAADTIVLVGVVATQVKVFVGTTQIVVSAIAAPVFPATSRTVRLSGLVIPAGRLSVEILGTGATSLSHLFIGKVHNLGRTMPEVEVGMTDFSTKDKNKFGVVRIRASKYSRSLQGNIEVAFADMDRVAALMTSLNQVACFWVFDSGFQSLQSLGYHKSWKLAFQDAGYNVFSLTVEGLGADDAKIIPELAAATGLDLSNLANFNVEIESSNGDRFRVGQSKSTTLKARVFRGGVEVTDGTPAVRFRWRRASVSPKPAPNDDATWNLQYVSGYKQLTINVDDVSAQATFFCDVLNG